LQNVIQHERKKIKSRKAIYGRGMFRVLINLLRTTLRLMYLNCPNRSIRLLNNALPSSCTLGFLYLSIFYLFLGVPKKGLNSPSPLIHALELSFAYLISVYSWCTKDKLEQFKPTENYSLRWSGYLLHIALSDCFLQCDNVSWYPY
jgi:hypothetical protein